MSVRHSALCSFLSNCVITQLGGDLLSPAARIGSGQLLPEKPAQQLASRASPWREQQGPMPAFLTEYMLRPSRQNLTALPPCIQQEPSCQLSHFKPCCQSLFTSFSLRCLPCRAQLREPHCLSWVC